MLIREIGRSGISASAVGLGTWAIGGWMWGGTDEDLSIKAINASIDSGISLVDTAPAYGMGKSEEIVGKAISGRRDEVILTTKCGLVWHTNKGNYFFDQQDRAVHRYLGMDSIVYEVEQSLKRLKTDYIDLYITHWQDSTTPIHETMAAMDRLKSDGKIRAVGASNSTAQDIQEYVSAGQLDCVQEEYSMIKRDLETTLLPNCVDNNVSILSYSSLSLGLLSGKMGPDRIFEGDDQRRDNPIFSQNNRHKILRFMKEIEPICEAYNATKAQIVIAWTLQQPGITFSLCGARNPEQAIENAKAGQLNLSAEHILQINVSASKNLIELDN